MIAVNIADLTHVKIRAIVPWMFADFDMMHAERVDLQKQRVDGDCIVIPCDDDRATAIVQVLRLKLPHLRAYRKAKTWRAIPRKEAP